MNIDITTLLLGNAKTLADGEPLPDGEFSLELEEKLAEMGLLIPGLMTELPPVPDGTLPVLDAKLAALVADNADVAVEPVLPEMEEALAALAALTEQEGEASPQWQLQQLVTGNAQTTGLGEFKSKLAQTASTPVIRGTESAGEILGLQGGKPLKGAQAPIVLRTSAEGVVPAPQMMSSDTVQADAGRAVEATLPVNFSAPAQVSTPRAAMPVAPQSVTTIPHALETPEWKQAVSQQVVVMSRNGVQNAEIRLHPEELGSLHISLRVHQEQAQIHIASEHVLVRQVMEQALPQLRQAMADSGIQLGQANVSADSPFAGQNMNGEHRSGEQNTASQGEENGAEDESAPVVLTPVKNHAMGINIFA